MWVTSRLVLQPGIERGRIGNCVANAVATTVGVSVAAPIMGSAVMINVDDGTRGGVGERIAGTEDGDVSGVFSLGRMESPLQAGRKRRKVDARNIFIMIVSNMVIVSEFFKKGIVFSHKLCENKIARRWLPPSASGGYFTLHLVFLMLYLRLEFDFMHYGRL
jgi:hypothetical protein